MASAVDLISSTYQLKLRELRTAAEADMLKLLGQMRASTKPGADGQLLRMSGGKLTNDVVARCEAALPDILRAHVKAGQRDVDQIAQQIQTEFVDVALKVLPGASLYASVRGGAASAAGAQRVQQAEQARFAALRAGVRGAVPHYVVQAIGRASMTNRSVPQGRKIFIGHGRSTAWRVLKDFISDRLCLPWDEFNREIAAGLSTKERLQAMLSEASFAFLVMTGEDEGTGGRLVARANVIHEVGLFQGRLGFERAIILLEDGCEEFSNIVGLSQLRFPKDGIQSTFEDVRRVLEREGLLPSSSQ